MKKHYIFIFISFVLLIFVSCNSSNSNNHVHTGGKASCTETGICTICRESYQAPLGHRLENDCCVRCGKEASKGLEYAFNSYGDTYFVSGIGTCIDKDIIIPYQYNGKDVVGIGSYAFKSSQITGITLPSTVKYIQMGAFSSCHNICYISIPNSLTSIENNILPDVSNLTFNKYNNAVYLGNEQNPYLLLVKASNKQIESCEIHQNTKFVYEQAFYECSGLTEIIIPDSVIEVGNSTFAWCSNLKNIVFSKNMTSISSNMFDACHSITDITIPSNIQNIGSRAFYRCSGISNIIVPKTVTTIGPGAFEDCTSLTSITLPFVGGGNNPFSSSTIKYIFTTSSGNIPESLRDVTICGGEIGAFAFSNCKYIENITLKEGVSTIRLSAFSNCNGLTEIIIPSSVTEIGSRAFTDCVNLSNVTIKENVKIIGGNAFSGCKNLTTIIIPDSVEMIDASAFKNCSNLNSVVLGKNLKTIGGYCFQQCPLSIVYYKGNQKSWNNISIYHDNNVLKKAPICFYSSNKPVSNGNYWHYVDGVPTKWN